MSWSKTASNEWRSPFGDHEQLHLAFRAATIPLGREHWSISVITALQLRGITTKELQSALLNAWIALRFEHPAIAASHDAAKGEKVYESPRPGSGDLQDWMKQTFVVIDKSTKELSTPTHSPSARAAEDLVANFKPHELPTVYFLPKTSELIYHTSHWRTDGYGAVMLMDRLLALTCSSPDTSSLPWGEEVARLHPTVEDVLGVPSDAPQASQDLITARITKLVSGMPSTGVAYQGDNDKLPAGTRHLSLTFSTASTKALVDACKATGLAVSVAINAATARTTFLHEAAHSRKLGYATAIPVSLRHLLPEPYKGPAYASNFGMSGHGVVLPRGLSFMETARALTTQYNEEMTTPDFVAGARVFAAAFGELVSTAPPPDWPPPSEIINSSLGIIERHLTGDYSSEDGTRSISVKKFRLGVEMMNRQLEMHVWTFRGQLTLSLSFNEAYYPDAKLHVLPLLRTVQRELEQGLGAVLEAVDSSP